MILRHLNLLLPFWFVFCFAKQEPSKHGDSREGKIFSMFQIVTFPNDPCIGTGNKNGTCYTNAECESKGGVSAGTCANGFGTCCISTINCGGISSENGTYFERSSEFTSGVCRATICPVNKNICQLRLDFDAFVIAGPSARSDTQFKITGGVVNKNGKPVSLRSQCLTDQFQVTNSDGINPPVICGSNTNEHMYLSSDRTGGCTEMSFILSDTPIDTTLPATRYWSIKVSQYSCDYRNLAPDGCVQYFYGPDSGIVRTFNYGNQHLANQDQSICVRREQGNTRICWTAVMNEDFMVSGTTPGTGFNTGDVCCGYGTNGADTNGYDCLEIPVGKGTNQTAPGMNNVMSHFCGNSLGLVTGTAATTPGTVCSCRTPFYIRFVSDGYEFVSGGTNPVPPPPDGGFQLVYFMNSDPC